MKTVTCKPTRHLSRRLLIGMVCGIKPPFIDNPSQNSVLVYGDVNLDQEEVMSHCPPLTRVMRFQGASARN